MKRSGCIVLLAVLAVGVLAKNQHNNVGVPLTIEEPVGHKNQTLRYHLAHFGSVPYGEEYPRAVVHSFIPTCRCGNFPCYTGCGAFSQASAECAPHIVGPGGIATDQVHAFLLEETGGDVDDGCSRATRAFNVAKAGGDAAIIVARPGTKAADLVAAVDTRSAAAASEMLVLEHVDIPIGVLTSTDGKILKDVIASAGTQVKVKMDFRHLFTKVNNRVTIQVWHSTDDHCGPACHSTHKFMSHLGLLAETLGPSDALNIVPRFTFENCTTPGTDLCQRSCTNGRYCYERVVAPEVWGSLVAQENIRQACLYETLLNHKGRDTRKFWAYKEYFQRNCRTSASAFNEPCSEKAFEAMGETPDIYDKWKRCFKDLGTGEMQISVADDAITSMHAQKVSPYLGTTVVIRNQHFRGSLDVGHVMKAACSAMTDSLRAATPQCASWTQGACRPGSAGDRACSSQSNRQKRLTTCRESQAFANGYKCICSPGYEQLQDSDGVSECVDRNECDLYPTLCNRGGNRRNACRHVDGQGHECLVDVRKECTRERQYGGCWTEDFGGVTVTSCEDLFPEYASALSKTGEDTPLFRCNCEHIRGCWVGGAGTCSRKCPDGNCDPDTKQCVESSSDDQDAVAAGVGAAAAILVLLAGAVGFFVVRRRRGGPAKEARDAAARYVHFTSGHGPGGAAGAGTEGPGASNNTPAAATDDLSAGVPDTTGGSFAPGGGATELSREFHRAGSGGAGSGGRAARAAAYAIQAAKQDSAFAPETGSNPPQDLEDVALHKDTSLHVQEQPDC